MKGSWEGCEDDGEFGVAGLRRIFGDGVVLPIGPMFKELLLTMDVGDRGCKSKCTMGATMAGLEPGLGDITKDACGSSSSGFETELAP